MKSGLKNYKLPTNGININSVQEQFCKLCSNGFCSLPFTGFYSLFYIPLFLCAFFSDMLSKEGRWKLLGWLSIPQVVQHIWQSSIYLVVIMHILLKDNVLDYLSNTVNAMIEWEDNFILLVIQFLLLLAW